MAQIDAKLTMQMFDSELVRTHKIFIEQDTGTSVALRQDLEKEMRSDYLAFKEICELRPVAQFFSKDNQHTSLGVFAKCRLTYNEVVKGLTGFMVPIHQREIIPVYNDVSIFEHKCWEACLSLTRAARKIVCMCQTETKQRFAFG